MNRLHYFLIPFVTLVVYLVWQKQFWRQVDNPSQETPEAVSPSGWDTVATVPGTDVTFRYPHGGFFGQPSTLTPDAQVSTAITLNPINAQQQDPFVIPSFPVFVNYDPNQTTDDELLREAVITEAERDNSDDKRLVIIDGRRFLLEYRNISYGSLIATTIYRGHRLIVSTTTGAFSTNSIVPLYEPLFLDFLRHMQFGPTPSAK